MTTMQGPDNPYAPNTLDYFAYEQVRAGAFPDIATAIRQIRGMRPDLPLDPNGDGIRRGVTHVNGQGGGDPNTGRGYQPAPVAPTRGGQDGGPPAPSWVGGFTPAQGGVPRDPGSGGVVPKSPGYYRPGAQPGSDRYGGTMRGNTNAPGLQSNGDDDPWSIGAFEGGTYDPETLYRWFQRAQAGDGKAAWVLRQVGFLDEQNRPAFNTPDGLEQWAASRKLDRRAAQGASTPWYHDPGNWGYRDQGFRNEQDARDAYAAAPWAQGKEGADAPSSWRRPQAGGLEPGGVISRFPLDPNAGLRDPGRGGRVDHADPGPYEKLGPEASRPFRKTYPDMEELPWDDKLRW